MPARHPSGSDILKTAQGGQQSIPLADNFTYRAVMHEANSTYAIDVPPSALQQVRVTAASPAAWQACTSASASIWVPKPAHAPAGHAFDIVQAVLTLSLWTQAEQRLLSRTSIWP